MWRLHFPLLAIRLVGNLILTLAQAAAFSLGLKRFTFINLLLSFLIVALSLLWWKLPTPKPQPTPELPIALHASTQVKPLPTLIEMAQTPIILTEYTHMSALRDFRPQSDYVNLAILAHTAGDYEKTGMYLNLARYIDPNRDFFLK